MTLEQAQQQIQKAGKIISSLQSKIRQYRIAIYCLSILVCGALVFMLLQHNSAKTKLEAQKRETKAAQEIAASLEESLRIAQDSIQYQLDEREQAMRDAIQAMELYENTVKNLKAKTSYIARQKRTIRALEIQLGEKDREINLIASKFQKKYNKLKASMQYYSAYGLDSLKFSHSVSSGGVRAARDGTYLQFSGLDESSQYLVNVYPMNSPDPISERINSSMNGYIYLDMPGFEKKKAFSAPYVIEIQDSVGVIQWQYTVLTEMEEGQLESETEPTKRVHTLSLIGGSNRG